MSSLDYPKDYFVPLNGMDYVEGRITLSHISGTFNVEIDLVQKESKKIWRHVANLYKLQGDENEALELGMQKLSEYLKRPSKS